MGLVRPVRAAGDGRCPTASGTHTVCRRKGDAPTPNDRSRIRSGDIPVDPGHQQLKDGKEMASRTEGLQRWYTALYYVSFLTFAFTMGYGIGGFTFREINPEWDIHSVVYLILAGASVCSMAVWNISASDDGKRLVSRFTSIHMILFLILFSYRLEIAPVISTNYGSGTEKAVFIAVLVVIALVLISFIVCWYRIVIPKIRYTVYYDGGNADTDCTTVLVRHSFTFNPLFKLTVSAVGAEHRLRHGETAVITQETECFRIRLRYGLARRDVIISNADRVMIDVGYDCVAGVLVPTVESMGSSADTREMEDDVSRYL